MLILTINAFSEEALATSAVPKKRGGAPKPVLTWFIIELLAVAKEAKWLPAGLKLDDDWSSRKARLGDCAEWFAWFVISSIRGATSKIELAPVSTGHLA